MRYVENRLNMPQLFMGVIHRSERKRYHKYVRRFIETHENNSISAQIKSNAELIDYLFIANDTNWNVSKRSLWNTMGLIYLTITD